MRLLILPLILTALPASAAPRQAPEAPQIQLADPIARPLSDTCKRPEVHQAETPRAPESKKLADLPNGDLILSVFNEVEGCVEPIIVRYGEGRGPAADMPEPVRPGRGFGARVIPPWETRPRPRRNPFAAHPNPSRSSSGGTASSFRP